MNDNHGHAAGDLLLRVLAGRMREELRHDDSLRLLRRLIKPWIAPRDRERTG